MPRRVKVNLPWFQREHYEAINRLLADERLPATFDQWLKGATIHVSDMQARGALVKTVIIDPQEFAKHCAACGVRPSRATLGEFAITMARQERMTAPLSEPSSQTKPK